MSNVHAILRHDIHSTHQFFFFFWFVSSHQIVLYNTVAISISNPQSHLNYTAHFGDMKQEIGDLVGDFTNKLASRMDIAPKLKVWYV